MYAGNVRGTATQSGMGRGGGAMVMNGTAQHPRMRGAHPGTISCYCFGTCFKIGETCLYFSSLIHIFIMLYIYSGVMMQQSNNGQMMRNMIVQPANQYEQAPYGMTTAGSTPMQRAPTDPYGMQPSQPSVSQKMYLKCVLFFFYLVYF